MASKLGGKHKADGDLSDAFDKKLRVAPSQLNRKKVGVLISGSGRYLLHSYYNVIEVSKLYW